MFDEAYVEIDTKTRGVAVDPFDVRRGSDFQRCVPANVMWPAGWLAIFQSQTYGALGNTNLNRI